MTKKKLPEWAPENAGKEFASSVMPGVKIENKLKKKVVKRPQLSIDDYYYGILNQNRVILSKAITLIESNNTNHIQKSQELIKKIIPYSGKSVRIGITGPPGAGKSTFIESLGLFLSKNSLKVAVLAIDPSSTVTKGSILGDKTRMELLSREDNAYIRPSPSSGTLGGVAQKTRETILLCEAAGFDVILIETIGVGQNEITVRSMVDFFLLILLPGSGDELQGIKKGVVELADLIVINKADGDYKERASITQAAYTSALRLLESPTEGIKPKVMTSSAINHIGIENVWSYINEFMIHIKNTKIFEKRRNEQMLYWVNSMLEEAILINFFNNPKIKELKKELDTKVLNAQITPSNAVFALLEEYFGNK